MMRKNVRGATDTGKSKIFLFEEEMKIESKIKDATKARLFIRNTERYNPDRGRII